ncbi:MAG TPA: hypothetical protein VEA69_22725 [Tepidisphaeraceae bacterium]|nr:hypothetical protein [Tepidisphaeraceae bacterium]
MGWHTGWLIGMSDLAGWSIVIYAGIALVTAFVVAIKASKAGLRTTPEGDGVFAFILGAAWPVVLIVHFATRRKRAAAEGGRAAGTLGPGGTGAASAGRAPPLPPPASAGAPAGGASRGAAAVVTAAPGQQCARCGDRLTAHDAPRAWGHEAVCGRCAADLGVAG